ncbi:MAG: AAA family ATPase [Vicinamibacteria bacterium]
MSQVSPLPAERRWLVEGLWLAEGVGILGGAPKSWKTWLALELALAVASGRPALGRFAVPAPGPALLFCAEDSPPSLRVRFDGLAQARGVALESAPLLLLEADGLRLDSERDLDRLEAAVARVRPRLLVLDPFVRLARVDENSATEVSGVLGALRELQRRQKLAVLVVHHARKSPAAHPGQSLRGSSDFAAWGDSNLYVTRRREGVVLAIEHRSAPAPAPVLLSLEADPAPHLVASVGEVEEAAHEEPLAALVLSRLATSPRPRSTAELARELRRRKQDVVSAVEALRAQSHVTRSGPGWVLARPVEDLPLFPRSHP